MFNWKLTVYRTNLLCWLCHWIYHWSMKNIWVNLDFCYRKYFLSCSYFENSYVIRLWQAFHRTTTMEQFYGHFTMQSNRRKKVIFVIYIARSFGATPWRKSSIDLFMLLIIKTEIPTILHILRLFRIASKRIQLKLFSAFHYKYSIFESWFCWYTNFALKNIYPCSNSVCNRDELFFPTSPQVRFRILMHSIHKTFKAGLNITSLLNYFHDENWIKLCDSWISEYVLIHFTFIYNHI